MSDLRVGDIFTAVIVTDAEPKVVSDREVQAMVSAARLRRPRLPLRLRLRSGRRSGSGSGSRSRGVAQDGEPGSGRRPDGHALDRGRSRPHAAPPQALIVSLDLCTAGPSGPAVSYARKSEGSSVRPLDVTPESSSDAAKPPAERTVARARSRALVLAVSLAALPLVWGCATPPRRQAVPLAFETQATVTGFPYGIRYFPRDAKRLQVFQDDFVESWKREEAYRRSPGPDAVPCRRPPTSPSRAAATTEPSGPGCSRAGRRPARGPSSSSSRASARAR